MSDPRDHRPEDDDAEGTAAEYVLGTLPLEDRIAAENLAKVNPGFAARIAAWEQRLAPFNDHYPEVPAPDLLSHIEARLFGVAQRPAGRGFGRLTGWLTGAAVAAVLGVAVFIALPVPQPPGPALTATLAAEAQPLVFAAAYNAADGALTVTRTAGTDAAAGSDYELWVIVGDAAPVSLGVIDAASVTRPLPDLAPGAILAVSLEAAGGSTTGAPALVLVTGVVAEI